MTDLWKRIVGMLKPNATPPVASAPNGWTPEAVEARIELAGRDAVFEEARRLGWSPSSSPPMWVWGAIANDIIAKRGVDARTLH